MRYVALAAEALTAVRLSGLLAGLGLMGLMYLGALDRLYGPGRHAAGPGRPSCTDPRAWVRRVSDEPTISLTKPAPGAKVYDQLARTSRFASAVRSMRRREKHFTEIATSPAPWLVPNDDWT
jgi:hypothetical protein